MTSDPARSVLEHERSEVQARVARLTQEIIAPLRGSRHWFAVEVTRARAKLLRAIADRDALDELLAALGAADESIGGVG